MPVRFTLTADQKGDAPQAAALIEGLPAEVVLADTAYDADHFRQAIADKGALAVIPSDPSRALKYLLDEHRTPHYENCPMGTGADFQLATMQGKTLLNVSS